MNGQYHNPNDFWRQRMEPWEDDELEKNAVRFCKAILVVCALGLLAWLLCGCKTWKHGTYENRDSSDSVRIEYKEKIVKVPVTVYVEVPVERQTAMANDSSHLETTFAVSDAAMIWIDGVPFLRHSLENKPQKIEKDDSVSVVEKERIVWKIRRVTYTVKEIREKQNTWWEKKKILLGGWSILLNVVFAVAAAIFLRARIDK